jgi:hypothetical protein
MAYSEKDGQVVLRMSREDYELLMSRVGAACNAGLTTIPWHRIHHFEFINRLNSGNPHYTPYKLEADK